MSSAGIEQARYKGMLESLQQQDYEIDHIIVYSKFVVAYLLQQDGPNPGWRKANIEGPVYLVRRTSAPRYQLLVKNQFSTNDLLDSLHADWELDCQKNYVFYKVEDPSKRIRGLWFHDDTERQKLEAALEKTLEEIRSKPAEPHADIPSRPEAGDAAQTDALYAQFGLTKPADGPGAAPERAVPVTKESLRAAMHQLVDSEPFLDMLMQKLKENARLAQSRSG